MRFNVLLYPVVYVKVPNVEADSPEEAIEKAEALLAEHGCPLSTLLKREFRDGCPATSSEFADSMDSYMVDVLDPAGEVAESIDFAADGVTRTRTPNEPVA